MSTINLLPDDYLQSRAQHRANMLCIILFGVVMAGVGGAALVSAQSTRNTRQVRDQVNESYAKAATKLTQMQQLEAQKRTMIRKAKATAELLERVPRSYVLAVLTDALPENASLTEFQLEPRRKVTLAPSSGKRNKFQKAKAEQENQAEIVVAVNVTGFAATDVEVATFIANLLRHPLLQSVELGYSQEKLLRMKQKGMDDLSVREFKVSMEIRPDVDVIELVDSGESEETEVTAGKSQSNETGAKS